MSRIFTLLRHHLHFIFTASILTVVMTWPTVVHVFDTSVFWLPTGSADVWMMFWDTLHGKLFITGQADFYFTDLLFYPQGLSLVYHLFNVPHMLVFGGLQTLMPPSNAYSLTYLLFIFATACPAYIYITWLLQDKWLGLLGAAVFGFSQHVTGHPMHPTIGFIATLPLSLYFFHRGIREGRWKQLIISGILIGITIFISIYIFICILLVMGMYILYFAASRWRNPNFWLRIALLLFLIGSISLVRIYPMIDDSPALDSALSKNERQERGNDLLAWFVNYRHPILTPVFYDVFDITPQIPVTPFNREYVNGAHHTSYLGWLPLVLIGLGFFGAAYRKKMLPWLMLGLPFLILRLGSVLTINDDRFSDILLPKHVLNELVPPIFASFHQADHYQMGVLLPLAILSCYGFKTLFKSISARRRRWIILLAIAVIAFEYWYMPYVIVIEDQELAYTQWLDERENQDSIRLIHLPMGRENSKRYGFHQTLAGYPHAEGLAGRTPPDAYAYIEDNLLLNTWYTQSSIQCSLWNRIEYLTALDNLIKDGFSHIVLHYSFFEDDKMEVLESFSDAQSLYEDGSTAIYRLENLRDSCLQRIQAQDTLALYLNFFRSPEIVPRYESILSFHPTEGVVGEASDYYAEKAKNWKSLIHIFHNERDEIIIQSSHPEFSDQEGIVAGNDAIWLIYNPRRTSLQTMDAYTAWFARYYKPCQRLLETDNLNVDYYFRLSIPCELIDAQSPLDVHYDNEMQLFNAAHDISAGQASFYLWWSQTVDQTYAYSIQIFNMQGEKVQQADAVIGHAPLAFLDIDISTLDDGEYTAKLIVYDFLTKASQSGTVGRTQQQFEREIEIAQFTIPR